MSAAAATADAPVPVKPKKSRKLLFILIGLVVFAIIGAAGAFFLLKANTAEGEDGAPEDTTAVEEHPSPPTFLPLDSMVVNLADAGGNRFAQLGITLQLQDEKTSEDIKVYMPSIRNSILILISQRTSDEMLLIEGKEKLAADIINEISRVMHYTPPAKASAGPKSKHPPAVSHPVQGVLFSSFLIQ